MKGPELFYSLWPRRVADALAHEGVRTWEDLASLTAATLLMHKRFGRNSLAFVRAQLRERGLALSGMATGVLRRSVEPFAGVSGVYFLACERFIKIGHARDIRQRIKNLETVVPFALQLVYVEPCELLDARRAEREFHRRFADLRHRGEWYRREGSLAGFLAHQAQEVA